MLILGAPLKTGFCFAGGAQLSSAVKTVFKLWRKELLTFFIFHFSITIGKNFISQVQIC